MNDLHIDSGLLGVNVNPEPAPAPVPAPAVSAVPVPVGWTIHRTAALVRDLALNMYDLPFILKKHELSSAQYDSLRTNEFFQKTLAQMTAEWNGVNNTPRRLALEAAIALEDALPTVAARLSKSTEPLAGVVELAKLLAKMAGVGESATPAGPAEKFKITINLGADVLSVEKAKAPRGMVEVQSLGEGEGAGFALPPVDPPPQLSPPVQSLPERA